MSDDAQALARYQGCDCGGEHRTLGSRAWCLDCSEYCYPDAICEIADLRAENARLRGAAGEVIPPVDPRDVLTLEVDTSDIDPAADITIPLWRWHVLSCHSTRLRALIDARERSEA